jgi:hypothetical protein
MIKKNFIMIFFKLKIYKNIEKNYYLLIGDLNLIKNDFYLKICYTILKFIKILYKHINKFNKYMFISFICYKNLIKMLP